MSQMVRMQVEAEIQANAESFYQVFCNKGYLLPKICPDMIKDLGVIQGQWGTVGSVKQWTCVAADGKACVAKEIIEAIDTEINLVSFRVIEGDLMEHFKTCVITIQVAPKEEGSTVHWIIEYEKHHDDITDPHKLLEFCVEVSKDIDAHFTTDIVVDDAVATDTTVVADAAA